MMVLIWIVVLSIISGILSVIVESLCRFPHRTITEVSLFLRQVDYKDLITQMHPTIADILRDTFDRGEYRRAQQRQLHRIRENLQRISHNALMMIEVANTAIWLETKKMPGMEDAEIYKRLGEEVHAAGVNLRFYSVGTLIRIRLWMIFKAHPWSPLPAPEIPELRRFLGVTLDQTYAAFREAVGNLCLAYGQEFYDEIMSRI